MLARIVLAALLLLALPLAAAAPPAPEQASQLIRRTFDASVEALVEHQAAIRRDPAVAYRLIEEILAPHLDFELMARLVLGAHWKQASAQQRKDFAIAFRESLLRSYALVLSNHVDGVAARLRAGEVLMEARPLRAGNNPRRVTINTLLRLDQRTIPIDYRLYARGGAWRVYDVLIAGISFVANYRVEYDTLLRRQSLDQLIESLRKNRQPVWNPETEPSASAGSRPRAAASP